jgi:hypothetical protein
VPRHPVAAPHPPTGRVVLVERADALARRDDLFSLVIERRPSVG